MMKTKEKIIERLNGINDPVVLQELLQVVELEHDISQLYELTDEEKSAIDVGIEEADRGKLYSSDEANRLLVEWLKK